MFGVTVAEQIHQFLTGQQIAVDVAIIRQHEMQRENAHFRYFVGQVAR